MTERMHFRLFARPSIFNDPNRWDFGHCDLPFDSSDLEALDRLAQGGESFDSAQDREPVERLVEPFVICKL